MKFRSYATLTLLEKAASTALCTYIHCTCTCTRTHDINILYSTYFVGQFFCKKLFVEIIILSLKYTVKAGSQYDARSCVALCYVAQSYCKHAAMQRNARIDQPILAYALASQRNTRRKTLRHIVNQS